MKPPAAESPELVTEGGRHSSPPTLLEELARWSRSRWKTVRSWPVFRLCHWHTSPPHERHPAREKPSRLQFKRERRVVVATSSVIYNYILGCVARMFLAWRRSMQLRVVCSTLVLSLVVLMILAFVLMEQIITRLLDYRILAAKNELNRARSALEYAVNSNPRMGIDYRLSNAVRALNVNSDTSLTDNSITNMETVLMTDDGKYVVGNKEVVPQELRSDVARSRYVSYQFNTAALIPGQPGVTLVIGSPVDSDIDGLMVFLVFSLRDTQSTITVVQNTLLVGAGVLAVTLALIAYIVSRQVVLPVRSAALSAERFASGHLDERLIIKGEDDMSRLSLAFNEMAESLSEQIQQLKDYGNLQRQFTSDVSHELRTPLTTIRLAIDVLEDHQSEITNPLVHRSTELLVREINRFENLLKDLLEISRHDAGVEELSLELVDITVPIHESLRTVEHIAQASGTELIADLPNQTVMVDIDQRRIERILRNLLANAIDHSEGKPVHITMAANDSAVAIAVRDHGIGLKPGQEKLVFNRFWRAETARERRTGGTGLGLAISLEDARLHNGELSAWGRPGKGAVFRLLLPLRAGMPIGKSPLPLQPSIDIQSEKGGKTRRVSVFDRLTRNQNFRNDRGRLGGDYV